MTEACYRKIPCGQMTIKLEHDIKNYYFIKGFIP